jgi:GPH family glycoside/pentoside/hexuronide:cation symporter
MDPRLVGVAIFVFRMWDAITDPIMGAISDNSRLKWGRRRPFIVIGSLLSAFAFPLIWMVSANGINTSFLHGLW